MTVFSLLTRKGRRRFARYRDILSTFVRYGFGEIVYQTGVGKMLRIIGRLFQRKRKRRMDGAQEDSTWVRIRLAVEDLGPTFIKLGQILSNRPDLIPRPLQRELSRLQGDVPAFPGDAAIRVIEAELGRPVEELFREFDKKPIAAASIAQVHRAVLADGDLVAVKVQRPDIGAQIEADVEILKELARLLERYFPQSRHVAPRDIADEFERGIIRELDFGREGAAIERFAAQFQGDESIKVPRVYDELSSRRVLTMEYIQGRSISEIFESEEVEREEGSRIADAGANLTLKQIFTHGFFHADPHPGNIYVLDDGRLCYLDFGLTGNLIQRDLETVSDMLLSIMDGDEQKASKAVVRLAGSRNYGIAQHIEREIAELIDRFNDAQAADLPFTSLLAALIEVLVDAGLRLPADLYLLVKSLITIEGVATRLDPEFDFAAHLEPFAGTLVRERYSPERIRTKVFSAGQDYADLVSSFPGDYYRLVDTITNGNIRLALQDQSIEPARRALLQASSALVSAVVLGSLIIGSALIVHSKVPPLWREIPVIGIVGFVAAGLVGVGLLIKTIRTSGM